MDHPFADLKRKSSASTRFMGRISNAGLQFVKALIERSCEYRPAGVATSVDFERAKRYPDNVPNRSRAEDSGET